MTFKTNFKVGDFVTPFKLSTAEEYKEHGFTNGPSPTAKEYFGREAEIVEIRHGGIYLDGISYGWNDTDLHPRGEIVERVLPFDYNTAILTSAKVQTRRGQDVKILGAFVDLSRKDNLLAIVDGKLQFFFPNGNWYEDGEYSDNDLTIIGQKRVLLKAVEMKDGVPHIVDYFEGNDYDTEPFEVDA